MKTSCFVEQIKIGPMENFCYFLGDSASKEVFVIDPGWEADEILRLAKAQKLKIAGVLLTHSHFDHVRALPEIVKATGAPVYIHAMEAEVVKQISCLKARETHDNDIVQVGEVKVKIIHTPGHTAGSQCFLAEGYLFTGDTLFIKACGRCDLKGSDPEKMYHSLKRLRELDDNIVVYPGHHYGSALSSTIGAEKHDNPYLQQGRLSDFLKFRMN